MSSGGSVPWSLQAQLQSRWAALLGIDTYDLVLCGSESAAWNLLAHAVLTPSDVAVVAQPCDVAPVAAVVAAGGAYVDVGRSSHGKPDSSALQRAVEEHKDAIFIGAAPSWFGTSDVDSSVSLPWRAHFLDQTAVADLAGGAAGPNVGVDAVVVALRDLALDGQAVVYGVACADGLGAGLAPTAGPGPLPTFQLRQALASVQVLERDRAGQQAQWDERLKARRQRLIAVSWPAEGVRLFAETGLSAAVMCLDGNVAELASDLRRQGFAATGFGPHPMRSVIHVDLASSLDAIDAAS